MYALHIRRHTSPKSCLEKKVAVSLEPFYLYCLNSNSYWKSMHVYCRSLSLPLALTKSCRRLNSSSYLILFSSTSHSRRTPHARFFPGFGNKYDMRNLIVITISNFSSFISSISNLKSLISNIDKSFNSNIINI